MTRINLPVGDAYKSKIPTGRDGTFKATPPFKLRPGAVDVKCGVDMRPQFGNDFVKTVGTPTVTPASTITVAALGPRDQEAVFLLGGTAIADEKIEGEALVTMERGDTQLVTFEIEVFST